MALDQITSQSIADNAISAGDLADGSITAAKLHDTAIADKLGYTPASAATVASQISDLVAGAPTALNTLNELAAALGNDANYAATITTALGTKANTSSLSTVATSGSYNDLSSKPTLGSLAALNSVSASNISDGAVTAAKLGSNAVFLTQFSARTSQHSLGGDSGWVDHLSMDFTVNRTCSCLFIYSSSSSFESGVVQGFARLILDGTMIGYNSAVAKQSTANAAGSGTCIWDKQGVTAGTHTIKVQLRNTAGGSSWITPYWSADGQTANTLGVVYYGG